MKCMLRYLSRTGVAHEVLQKDKIIPLKISTFEIHLLGSVMRGGVVIGWLGFSRCQ